MPDATTTYTVPNSIINKIKEDGYPLPYAAMQSYITEWYQWMRSIGQFYTYNDRDSYGRLYEVRRRTLSPANRVCVEWASLLMNESTEIVTEDERCNEWLRDYIKKVNFKALGQGLIQRSFALGTGAWANWIDVENNVVFPRRYDARQVMPLSWDDDGIKECAFTSMASIGGYVINQLQMHVLENGEYHIKTYCYDEEGAAINIDGVEEDLAVGETQQFAIVKPAIENVKVDLSPYGQSVFADAIDVIKAVDLAYDAILNEIDLGKMRIMLSDLMFEVDTVIGEDGTRRRNPIPFGKHDNLIWRKVDTSQDMISTFAPPLRTESQVLVLRTSLQMLGDLTGFGTDYFDFTRTGGLKTATEVSADNSALMRNIRKHENYLEGSLATISRGLVFLANEFMGENLPDPGSIHVIFDDSIITDTSSEKTQDMAEINVTLNPWEYRMKWYGEDEETAKANVPGLSIESFDLLG